jgi:hypothetical protein
LESGLLQPGSTSTGWLEFDVSGGASDVFLDYLDPSGEVAFIVALV